MAADYDEASNKKCWLGDMAVRGSRDDKIERTDTMMGQNTKGRGQKEIVEGDVEISGRSEVEGGRLGAMSR
jgi:hypothetical protein